MYPHTRLQGYLSFRVLEISPIRKLLARNKNIYKLEISHHKGHSIDVAVNTETGASHGETASEGLGLTGMKSGQTDRRLRHAHQLTMCNSL